MKPLPILLILLLPGCGERESGKTPPVPSPPAIDSPPPAPGLVVPAPPEEAAPERAAIRYSKFLVKLAPSQTARLEKAGLWWSPGDAYWDIQRFRPSETEALHNAIGELYESRADGHYYIQRLPHSLRKEDFDEHCQRELDAGRIGLLQLSSETPIVCKYALCTKSASGSWVAIPDRALLTQEEVVWPPPRELEDKRPFWPMIGTYILTNLPENEKPQQGAK